MCVHIVGCILVTVCFRKVFETLKEIIGFPAAFYSEFNLLPSEQLFSLPIGDPNCCMRSFISSAIGFLKQNETVPVTTAVKVIVMGATTTTKTPHKHTRRTGKQIHFFKCLYFLLSCVRTINHVLWSFKLNMQYSIC